MILHQSNCFKYNILLHHVLFQLMVLKGSMHEAHFRTAKDPIKERVWLERIQPFLNEPKYSTVCKLNISKAII